jgi:hypothetical protein
MINGLLDMPIAVVSQLSSLWVKELLSLRHVDNSRTEEGDRPPMEPGTRGLLKKEQA